MIQAERDRLQDQTAGVITRDDIIVQARQSRDDAISRLVTVIVSFHTGKSHVRTLYFMICLGFFVLNIHFNGKQIREMHYSLLGY